MPFESPSTLNGASGLNASWPLHVDSLSQADSHIRSIKSVLQSTFPNIAAPLTASDVDLNQTTGLKATVTALAASSAQLAGATFSGAVNAPSIQKGGNELLPAGVIAMWSGAATAVPAGWHLCDGTGGTPDLRGAFIVGAGGSGAAYAVGTNGGAVSQTVTTVSAGSHSHTGATGPGGGGSLGGQTTDTQGTHYHGGSTQDTALQVSQIPPHAHNLQGNVWYAGSNGGGFGTASTSSNSGAVPVYTNPNTQNTGGGATHNHGINGDGSHYHNVTSVTVPAHTHSISADGLHTHSVTVPTLPPYFALCFIMKL